MTATIRRLMLIADVRRSRLALAALLGALTILFGVGLMGTAGYLISRAAEQPTVLSLTAAIVGVRFFGLARPLARYLERLASHDVALRSLGRARARVYEAIEPLAPAQLEDLRRGDLLSRFVADVDSLQNLYLRGLEPPLVALVAGGASVALAAVFLPEAAVVLGAGLLLGGILVPVLAESLASRSAVRQAAARGALSAELVEVFPNGALVEEKFDGIRAQVHKRGDKIEMYSRTLDRITEFPELAEPLRNVPGDFILDGEIIGWRDGRAIPFRYAFPVVEARGTTLEFTPMRHA